MESVSLDSPLRGTCHSQEVALGAITRGWPASIRGALDTLYRGSLLGPCSVPS